MFLNEGESAKSRLKYITTTRTHDTLHPQHHSIKEKMESHVFVANDQYRWDGVSLPSICRKFRIGGGRSSHGITKLCRTCFTRDSNLMDGEGTQRSKGETLLQGDPSARGKGYVDISSVSENLGMSRN